MSQFITDHPWVTFGLFMLAFEVLAFFKIACLRDDGES